MMTPAARSLQIFGLYLRGAGGLLMLAPAALLGLLGLPAPADAWGRVAGLLVLFLGIYYLVGARAELLSFMRASVASVSPGPMTVTQARRAPARMPSDRAVARRSENSVASVVSFHGTATITIGAWSI